MEKLMLLTRPMPLPDLISILQVFEDRYGDRIVVQRGRGGMQLNINFLSEGETHPYVKDDPCTCGHEFDEHWPLEGLYPCAYDGAGGAMGCGCARFTHEE